jgi:hypothetical protein
MKNEIMKKYQLKKLTKIKKKIQYKERESILIREKLKRMKL